MNRVWVLTGYLLRELFRSLTGLLVVVAAAVFYLVAIQSVTGGIDPVYYALVIGGFFAILTLVLTVVIADRAYHAKSYLLLYRVPSRAIFLSAVLLAALAVGAFVEIAVALVSLFHLVEPLSVGVALDILPVWISWLVLGAALGLHLSELVRRGWSRAVAYGLLAFILFALNQQETGVPVGLADRFSWIPRLVPDPVRWDWAIRIVRVLIWPVASSVAVARSAAYTNVQSLSPAVLLIVSGSLFALAALLFSRKDLVLPEG